MLLGKGDGSFEDRVLYVAGRSAYSIALGDFNSDGNIDLVAANSGSSSVSVMLGKGNGTFQAAVRYGAGNEPNSVAVGDFNGDGRSDLVVANTRYTNANVTVLLGKGDGHFQSAVSYAAGITPDSVAVGDFNGDGETDLAVADLGILHPTGPIGGGGVSVLFGNGDGSFRRGINYWADINADRQPRFNAVAVSDLNGDGRPDLVLAQSVRIESGISVLLNTCGSAGFHLRLVPRSTGASLSWPPLASGFILESTTNLTKWEPAVEGLITTNNGRLEVTIEVNRGERYFRLRKP